MQQDIDIVIGPQGFMTPLFTWNPDRTSHKLKLQQQCLNCTVIQGSGFKTTLGTQIFNQGQKYYFQVKINKGSLIKIGVARPNVNVQEAFSDTPAGWAIYNGQLRHCSNASGTKYGKVLTVNDVIGVALDMTQGTLQFYCNGISWGTAYSDAQLKKGQLVAACAPIYHSDSFTLRSFVRED